MKFVALLSGGKDSCYNIMKCLSYGHEIVCVANLCPLNDQEINSYMYQSAASNLLPLLSQALNLPLLRYSLKGEAVVQSLDYNPKQEDEVEDLYQLLKIVKVCFRYSF